MIQCNKYFKRWDMLDKELICKMYKDDLDEKILTRLKNIGDNYCESVS